MATIPINHKLKNEKIITIKQIQNETLILLGANHCFREQILEIYPQLLDFNKTNNLQRTLEGTSLETIRYTVAANNGITILPCTATQQKNSLLKYIPLEKKEATRNVVLVYRNSFTRKKY